MPKLGMGPIRREQICRAAVAVIAREGYAGTTMRMVAEEAGVSTGMLNHYFANRQDLLIHALVYVSERSLVRYAGAIEGLEPGVGRLEALRLPELRRTIEERLGPWFVLIDEALEGLVSTPREGEVPRSVCVDSVLTGLVIMAMTSEAQLDRTQIRDEVIRFVLADASALLRRPPWAGGPRPPAAPRYPAPRRPATRRPASLQR